MRRLLLRAIRRLVVALPFGERLNIALTKTAISRGLYHVLVPPDALRSFFRLAASEQSDRVDGPIAYFEAGVFAGQSMAIWHDVCRELGIETRAVGADSFQGLPESAAADDGDWRPGMFWCPRPVTEWNLSRLGAPLDRIRLVEGWFDDTLTDELAVEVGVIHVAMVDADTYSSTVPVLRFFDQVLDDVAWVIVDDWYSGGNYDPATGDSLGLGVERAFREWIDRSSRWEYETIGTYDLPVDSTTRPAGRVFRLTRRDD